MSMNRYFTKVFTNLYELVPDNIVIIGDFNIFSQS